VSARGAWALGVALAIGAGTAAVGWSAGLAQAPGPVASVAPIAQQPACPLLDRSEVAAAIGSSIEEAQDLGLNADDTGWITECVYWRHQYHDQAPLDVTLASGPTYLARFDDIRTEPETSPIGDLGDDAVLRLSTVWGLDQPVGALFVRIGDAVIGLSLGIVDITDDGTLIQAGDGPAQKAILLDLARTAIGHLTGPRVETAKTCQLLSVEDAASLTGAPLTSTEDVDEHDEWGPACHYTAGDENVLLFVGVNRQPDAASRFDACSESGQPVPGVGEDAFIGQGDCRYVKIGFYGIEQPLMTRSGDLVLTVAQPMNDPTGWIARLTAVARQVLQELGVDPGTVPTPVSEQALGHPCGLISDAEVSTIVGEPITSTYEEPSTPDYPVGDCEFHAGDGGFVPFDLQISAGPDALRQWGAYRGYERGDKMPVEGIGDEALSETSEGYADQPLVRLMVLSGDAVLELAMGTIREAADYSTEIAPGTPDQQLEMLRELADIILPRLRQ
jgi:hypothetical protein